MRKILIAELKQETATFNPVPTRYDDFRVYFGHDILEAFGKTRTELAGALDVFQADGNIEVIPTIAAAAVSGGPVATADFDRLLGDFVNAIRECNDADAAYICLHGAMAGEDEGDPEGRALAEIREILGDKPIVASLDLHAVVTDRMVRNADILVPFHTYPHIDQYETGRRAAKNLLRLLDGDIRPATARVELPMLVRGDELITKTGRFGEAICMCQEIEASPKGLAAGVIIGNAFTDVPALQSNVLVTTDDDLDYAKREAEKIGRFMWENRELFQAPLTPLADAIRLAIETDGLTIFSDAADATASGAPGDSNAILKGLLDYESSGRGATGLRSRVASRREFAGSALLSIVDAPAVDDAFDVEVAALLNVALGGTRDPGRHQPVRVDTYVKSLHDGDFTYEDGTAGRAGRAAVLSVGRIQILVTERPVFVVGRRVFECHGLLPEDFDIVVVKSPNGFRTYYESIASRIVPVDVPGATSANLKSLPFKNCVRPIFPLDDNVQSPFVP